MNIRRKLIRPIRRTKRYLLVSISIIVFISFILWSDVLERFEPEVKISCHFIHSNDSFPVLDRSSHLPSRSIFFHDTSCTGNLTSRQNCAIESAAITHPEWQINVVFSGPILPLETYTQKKFNNVKFWRIYIEEFSKGTPYEKLVKHGVLKQCTWSVELSRDVLKYMTLAKWGGIYLDFDMVVARPLGSLARNWATRDNKDTIGEGVLAFSRDTVGRNVSKTAVKAMESVLRRGDCSIIRPRTMTSVLKNICSTADATYMSSVTCNGFEVYGPQFFHPIPETRARDYFVSGELVSNNAYTYHLWDHITTKYRVMRSSPFAKLARRFCPLTFKLYSDQFGF